MAEKFVTIEAKVGSLIIAPNQIESVFRKMFEDGIACANRHFTNDDLENEFFKARLDVLLKPFREGTQVSKYSEGGKNIAIYPDGC